LFDDAEDGFYGLFAQAVELFALGGVEPVGHALGDGGVVNWRWRVGACFELVDAASVALAFDGGVYGDGGVAFLYG
jgi:hypothetical protein